MKHAAAVPFALLILAGTARAQDGGPLRLLVQVDGTAAVRPSPLQDPEDPPDRIGWRVRRARVGDEVTAHDVHLRVLFEGRADTAAGVPFPGLAGGQLPFGGAVRLTETFVGWAPHRGFELDAGSLRVPFSLSRQVDEGDLRLPERPAFVDAFTPDFRTGVSMGGDLGELLYQAALFSADRAVDERLFRAGLLAAGRLVAEPLGPVGRHPWWRGADDPWYGWFRFAAGVSVMYGTLDAPRTLAVDPEFTAQWRKLVVSAEYFVSTRFEPGTSFGETGVQGAALEPGLTWLSARGTELVAARAEWQRVGGANLWGAGLAVTGWEAGSHGRVTVGAERRWSDVPPAGSYWFILRLTLAVN